MPTEKKAAKTYLPPERHAQLAALAASEGQTVSVLLGRLIGLALEGEGTTSPPDRPQSRARREGKVTVRLAADVRQDLEEEARSQGVTISTWTAALLSARMRQAPQMVSGERRGVRAAYRQLRGLAVNTNQIAHALNRGVLTGAGANLTKAEVEGLRRDIAQLRRALSAYAEGRFQFQSGQGEET
ncbi:MULTISPECIES: plasmid mobilization relaxosome protein MobC [Phaeobacter]|uniref:plasmid mobilization relaxosome protein MobC n=1 Tax=Phaeobacter TaxID=302485 RepID=UPI001FD407CE|nr:plasmid mobilization relaxosome protein MobC [Phaeobacter sp. J2-8]MCJ7871474.1 MobC family plasmid mobilization relaxosome protein [Phaeobacter sp. J2-8]